MIPEFENNGNLPSGIHLATWTEFEQRFGNTVHRKRLLQGLAAIMKILKQSGCSRIYVDGSFVTSKAVPGDFDAAWDHRGVDMNLLKYLEPVFFQFSNQRAAQKAKYLGEFFPSSAPADSRGNTFLHFFQVDKYSGNPKGIVALDL